MWRSGEPGELVEHERASHRNVERSTDSQHWDLDNLIEIRHYLGWQPRVLMTEKYHGVLCRLTDLLERNRILVEFHSDDLSSMTPCSFDPTDLRLDPVEARPSWERVPLLQCLAVVVGLRHCHACTDGIAGPQQRPEVRAIGNPKRSDYQVVRTRNRRMASIGVSIRTPVPAAQGVRKRSRRIVGRTFMGIGLLGVRGPSLSRTED
jgi:hypothetical protein